MSFYLDSLRQLSEWQLFWLLAPALVFDTSRYYLTNFIYFVYRVLSFPFRRRRKPEALREDVPMVSVILPVFNEGSALCEVLDSILASSYPNFEVLVVDDASSDETPQLCRAYQEKGLIRYFRRKTRGSKPSSLNVGLFFAKGEYILHLDGDTLLHPDAVRHISESFHDPKVGVVAGNLFARNARENPVTLLQSAEFAMTINAQRRWLAPLDMLQIASGAFSAFRSEVLRKSHGVDAEYGEDLDITLRARKMGYRVTFSPEAVASTEVPLGLKGVFLQRLRWDRCYIRLNLRKHLNLFDIRRFRWGDFVSGVLDFVFNLLLLLLFPVYLLWVALEYPQLLLLVLTVTYLFYTFVVFTQLILAYLMCPKGQREWRWFLTVPFFIFYSTFLRIPRTLAYFLEFFRSEKLESRFFPAYVRRQIPRY